MRAERRRDPTAAQLLHARARAASDRCRFHEFARKNGADGQTRTADRRFTKPLLYRLSYVGADFLLILACSEYQGDGPRDGCVAVRREGVHLRSISTALTSGGACVRCRCPFSWQIALYVAAVCGVPDPSRSRADLCQAFRGRAQRHDGSGPFVRVRGTNDPARRGQVRPRRGTDHACDPYERRRFSVMPHTGHRPGSANRTSGCIEQVYSAVSEEVATTALAPTRPP